MDREEKTKKTEKKKKHWQAITVAMKKEIIEKHKQGATLSHLCSMYGKLKSTIFSILKDKEKFMEAKVSTGITWFRVVVNPTNQVTGCLPVPPGCCPDTLQ